jgi:hypothetical protein
MSDSVAFALIIANFLVGFVCFLWASKLAGDISGQVETGVIHGAPFSTKGRWVMLYSYWVGYGLAAIAAGLLTALVSVGIAAHTTDEHVRTISYVNAVVGTVGAFGWIGNAIPQFIHYRSVIRQAEAD